MSRLTEDRLAELYAGTLRLVAEHGFDNLTMDHIAEETRSSKATLYRQWGSKIGLVVESLRCLGDQGEELPDTGSLRGDLAAIHAREQAKDQSNHPEADLITAIMHAMKQNPELAEAVRLEILEPSRERIRGLVQRAVDRGEIAPDNPALPYVDLLFMAPVILRPIIDGGTIDHAYVVGFHEGVLLPALGIH